ncbi:MAG: LysM peptidoglycan-binding domain-containing protein [Parachlamydiales bacterium]|jgi:LysM repeat protein
MNRREVIAVTVIINVILLSVLFFMANRMDVDIAESPQIAAVPLYEKLIENKETVVPQIAKNRNVQETPVDEVDTVLRDFAAAVAASQQQQIAKVDEPVPSLPPQIPSPLPPPSPIKPATSGKNQNMIEIVVKRGDFLQKIANQNGSTIEAIKLANNLKNDQLKVGQVLRIPLISRAEPIALASPKPTPADGAGTYRVKSGDSPWKISKLYNVSAEEILRLNNLDENSAKNLKPGDVIRVPQ